MRLTAAMFFYDEDPDELYTQVNALGGLADRLVAVRGRWEGFPAAEQDNLPLEVEALRGAATDANIDLRLFIRESTFPGEVAQRNYTLQKALQQTLDGLAADWILLMDADERVLEYGDTRTQLENQEEDVGTVLFHTLEGPEQPLTKWEVPGTTSEQRRFFRAKPGLRFERHHWWLLDDFNAYWGEVPGKRFAKAARTDTVVEHRTCVRTAQRWKAKREFAAIRDPADKARGFEY